MIAPAPEPAPEPEPAPAEIVPAEAAPATHDEVTDDVAPQPEDDGEPQAPFAISATLESSVGQGSFVADENVRNAYVAWGLTVVPSYKPNKQLRLSILAQVAQELTDSDGDTARQELRLSDVQLRGRYAIATIPAVEINVAAEGRLYLPASQASQFETLVAGTQARVLLSRELSDFEFGFVSAFRKNFHSYESPVLNIEDAPTPPPLHVRAGGSEDLAGSAAAVGGNNVSYSFFNELSVGYSPLRDLSFGISYGLSNAFAYASYESDALSSVYADPGRGHRDLAVGSISCSYKLDSRFSFSGGVTTTAAPKTADNQSFRFPFYDFSSTAENLTLFFVDVTVTEPFGD